MGRAGHRAGREAGGRPPPQPHLRSSRRMFSRLRGTLSSAAVPVAPTPGGKPYTRMASLRSWGGQCVWVVGGGPAGQGVPWWAGLVGRSKGLQAWLAALPNACRQCSSRGRCAL